LRQQQPTGIVSLSVIALLWLSSSLFLAIIDAMNRIKGVNDTRPIWKLRLAAMLMSLIQAAIFIAAAATTVAWPQILGFLGLGSTGATLLTAIHGITIVVVTLLSFALPLYFGPDANQRWE
jgi:membrane protein